MSVLIFFASMFLFLNLKTVAGFPPVASEYYGIVTINSVIAPVGTSIAIYDMQGVECGRFIVKEKGKYGFISCKGDDLSTSQDEGASRNERLIFYIDGKIAKLSGESVWSEGSFHEVNLAFDTSTSSNPVSGQGGNTIRSGRDSAIPDSVPPGDNAESEYPSPLPGSLGQSISGIDIIFALILIVAASLVASWRATK